MKPTKIQQVAIEKLLSFYINGSNEVLLNSPTGSGKTFMISSFIANLIEANTNEKLVFVIATLSSANLPKQFIKKINKYNPYLACKLDAEYKDPPSNNNNIKDYEPNMIASENKIFVVGKSSFGKNTIYYERGIFDGFLQQIVNENYKLIYIRDEAHWGLSKDNMNSDEKNFESRIQDISSFTIYMTATPKHKIRDQVVIYEEELVGDGEHLIKQSLLDNKGVSKLNIESIGDPDLLDAAINNFIEVKNKYIQFSTKNNCEINPAMLIQVDSKTQKKEKHFNESLEMIKKKLDENNLIWYKYFGDDKESSSKEIYTLDEISENNSPVDVIIFKVGPATGWDIPRACFLVQLRRVNSQLLNKQTLGRIKRNASPDLKYHRVTDNYYLYSNYQSSSRLQETYLLKKKFFKTEVSNGRIIRKEFTKENFQNTDFENWFKKLVYGPEFKRTFNNYYNKFFSKKDPILLYGEDIIENKEHFSYYKEKINDLIDLRLYNLNLKRRNMIFFKMVQPMFEEYAMSNNFSIDKVIFIFNYFYLNELLKQFRYMKRDIDKNNLSFIQFTKELPISYSLWEEKNKESVNFNMINEIYAYDNNDSKKETKQTIDSLPEIVVMKEIINIIKQYPEAKLFAKNPVWVGASFEYVNELDAISKSYLDFIIKFNDIDILIEVKKSDLIKTKNYKEQDYDKKKTERLQEGYAEYAKILKNAILVLASVGEKNSIHYEFFDNVTKKIVIKDLEDLLNYL